MSYPESDSQESSAGDLSLCRAAIDQRPELFDLTGPVRAVFRLSGLTNHVFRIETAKGSFVLRLPRAENAALIDRASEAANLRVAVDLGVTVPPLYLEPETGVLVLPALVAGVFASPEELGRVLARLHTSPEPFATRRDLPIYLEECLAQISGDPALLAFAKPLFDRACELVKGLPNAPEVPSHFDPSTDNQVREKGKLFLIDFEYAAQAPAGWDLAYAIQDHGYSEAQEDAFLEAYGGSASVPTRAEIAVYKILCDTISMLWGLEQHHLGNTADDFLGFAAFRRGRAYRSLGWDDVAS